jgi:hypothetical protein
MPFYKNMKHPKMNDDKKIPVSGDTKKVLTSDMYNNFLSCYTDENSEKEITKMIKEVEKIVRSSLEYRNFLAYLKQELNLTRCTFFSNIDSADKSFSKVKIEFHHYPFSLYDVVKIVLLAGKDGRSSYYFNSFLIADLVLQLHYKGWIGLVPLSKTLHELAHSGKLAIPISAVFGNIEKFIDAFSKYFLPEHLAVLQYLDAEGSLRSADSFNKKVLKVQPLSLEMEIHNPISKITYKEKS